ncbi:MAG: FCD domain-containing protein [Pseudonocardiaceae bacterium]|nr:FCD domain-containing protein [Pseudonocardiaceae bacterium]
MDGPVVSSPSKSQLVYDAIKTRIVDGSYGPGYRLVLDQLAKELAVSPVPVREAIRRLEAEEFVRFERNVGARVIAIDPTEYRYTMQSLAIVEGAATALAAPRLDGADLDRAGAINDRMRQSLRDFDPRAFTALNHEFHGVLFSRCPNPHLVDLVRREWTRLATIRESSFVFVPGRAQASVCEHDRLLDLIAGLPDGDADVEGIEQSARAHRLATMNALLARDSFDGDHREDRP